MSDQNVILQITVKNAQAMSNVLLLFHAMCTRHAIIIINIMDFNCIAVWSIIL